MKKYSNRISLIKNARGVYDLDTVKGCKYGLSHNPKGCYGNCYAYNGAARYGYDFKNSVKRNFISLNHEEYIKEEIKKIDMPFIRIGVSGDPSECWEHTINVCEKIKDLGKEIVIITKHWLPLPENLYERMSIINPIINTSVSALDGDLLEYRLGEYRKMKILSKSILRLVSCDFNTNNIKGQKYKKIQDKLFENYNILDTVLRIPEDHYLVKNRILHIEKVEFLNFSVYASLYNKNAYLGYCSACPEMCGLNI